MKVEYFKSSVASVSENDLMQKYQAGISATIFEIRRNCTRLRRLCARPAAAVKRHASDGLCDTSSRLCPEWRRRERSRPQTNAKCDEVLPRYSPTSMTRGHWRHQPPLLNPLRDVMPAGGKKESDTACHVWLNFRTQLLELFAEQRSQQKGKENQILEEPRRCCEALGRERR